ncbi:MAG: LuxR C-terminal-related transcriptional regulator [Tepidisphaeraceae bacterium]
MSHSTSVRLRDVIRVMRLVAETVELGHDAYAWRQHFGSGLLKLIDNGGMVLACVMRRPLDPTDANFPLMLWIGADAAQISQWNRFLQTGDITPDPNTPALTALGARNFVRRREQLCTDRQWYGSAYFNEFRRPLGMEDILYSQVMAPDGQYSEGFGFGRALKSRPFDARHSAIVRLAHMELARIRKRGARALSHLGPRQQAVLGLLCEGYIEKEAAAKLSLSQATVHNYISMLHRKLDVHSRGELVRAGLNLLRRQGPKILPTNGAARQLGA